MFLHEVYIVSTYWGYDGPTSGQVESVWTTEEAALKERELLNKTNSDKEGYGFSDVEVFSINVQDGFKQELGVTH